MAFDPNPEQIAVERLANRPDHPNIKVIARAGTGKSSTFLYVANSMTRPSLYLAFGAKNAAEAKKKFPAHVRCVTTHALAHQALEVNRRWPGKLGKPWPTWRLAREFVARDSVPLGISAEHVAYAAYRCALRFMHSANDGFRSTHFYDPAHGQQWFEVRAVSDWKRRFPWWSLADFEKWKREQLPAFAARAKSQYAATLETVARDIWRAMLDPAHPLPLEHDAYLKFWQLQRPVIGGVSCLMVDEVQDSNPCTMAIIEDQTCQVMIVGDPAQELYQFRGSQNAMDDFAGEERSLRRSYRFGPSVAEIANRILDCAYPPGEAPLIGFPALDTKIGLVAAPYALIGRTNAGLFDAAARLVADGRAVHVVGGIKEAAAKAISVYGVWRERPDLIVHPAIREFSTWELLEVEAQYDPELGRYKKLVEDRQDELPILCQRLLDAGETPKAKADVVLLTAHKAKGLEFDRVRLCDDFRFSRDEQTGALALSREQCNLLYVAATRAKLKLEPNALIEDITRNALE